VGQDDAVTTPEVNADQREYWNTDEARHWVDEQDAYDRQLAPYAARLLEGAAIGPDESVVDIGCGTGSTTCDAARAASRGDALGLDISRAMVEGARARASRESIRNVTFEVGDAQTRRFEPASADVVISRFGVMFFDDPVTAFANLRSCLRPGGRLVFVCWQEMLRNEWIAVPAVAALQHIPMPEPGPPDAPGPFSLADPQRVHAVLAEAGYHDITLDPVDDPLLLAGGGSLTQTVTFLRGTGMARALLDGAPPDAFEAAITAIEESLAPFETPDGFRLGSAGWLVRARV
jgi:SAM-dependent methyltransferase